MSTDVTRMMDKLHSRCAESSNSVKSQPVTERQPIKWKRKGKSDYAIQSEDMAYEVEKRYAQTRVCSDSMGYVYLVFRMDVNPVKLLGMYPTADEAKSACELDRESGDA